MANIFVRISEVITANINGMIDQAENPERMIRQIIREMEHNIVRAREGVVDAITSEKRLERELEHHRGRSGHWLANAEEALRGENEELAMSALERKKDHDLILRDMEVSWKAAKDTSQTLKSQLRSLENKLAEARRKRTTLSARQRAAEARQHMDVTVHHFQRGLDTQDRFDRMEDRVLEIEARAEAVAELNDESEELEKEIRRLSVDKEVKSDLDALRKKIKEDEKN